MAREAEHVRTLVRRVFYPDEITDAELARRMHLRDKPYRTFDDAAAARKIPPAERIEALAAVLEVDVMRVLEACLLDVGLPPVTAYDHLQHRAAELVERIPADQRGLFVDGLDKITQAWRAPS